MITMVIDDQYVDLPNNVPFSLTLQAAKIGDLTSRFVSHTNEFKVSKTYTNKIITDHAHDVKSKSEFPYSLKSAEILMNGLPVIKGVVFLKEASNFYSLSVFDNVLTFFDRIEGLSIQDLDFGDSPVTWNDAYIDSRRNATSGIVTPVINYGQIDTLDISSVSIGDVYFPSVYYRTIIETIFSNAGFTLLGDILDDDKFNRFIIAYSNPDWPGSSFRIHQILPDISQADFIKHFIVTFGLIFKEDKNVITAYMFKDILKDKQSAVDWTSRRVLNINERLSFDFQGFAQKNYFIYGDGESNPNQPFPDGFLEVEKATLEEEKVIYQAPFKQLVSNIYFVMDSAETIYGAALSPSLYLGAGIPTNYPPTTPFVNNPEPLLLLIRDRLSAFEPAVIYDGNSRTDYKVGYSDVNDVFYDTLEWQDGRANSVDLLTTYYSEIQASIRKPKNVERFYNLSVLDIVNLDLTKLVYDSGSYFLINKIHNFIPGKITKVELFKVL